jgi:hypothetical protein
MDSGASYRVVKDASLLLNSQPANVRVTTANQEDLHCSTKGKVVIINHAGEPVLLKDVPLQHALTCNLLFVKRATEAGLKVEFGSLRKVTLNTQRTQKMLPSGTAACSLFALDGYALALTEPTSNQDQPFSTTSNRQAAS